MSIDFLISALVRALKTFCQTFVAGITVGSAINEVDWATIASVAVVAAVASVLTSLCSLDIIGGEVFTVEEADGDEDENDTEAQG